MYYYWLAVVLALVVFTLHLPVTLRRFRAQRDALRPIEPVSRIEHFPCVVNTIGAFFTEFCLLGLMTLVVFVTSSAAITVFGNAPDISTGLRHLSLGAIMVIVTLVSLSGLLLMGGAFARSAFLFCGLLGIVIWMVIYSAGEQWSAILLFALFAVGAPVLMIRLLRRLL